MRVQFTIPGEPVGKGRPRFTRRGGTYTPEKTRDYEKRIRECWEQQSGRSFPDGVPIRITVRAYFAVPKSYPKKRRLWLFGKPHMKSPDLDNCIKIVADGCQGAVFGNDSAIYCIAATKYYSAAPRMEIILEGDLHEEEK